MGVYVRITIVGLGEEPVPETESFVVDVAHQTDPAGLEPVVIPDPIFVLEPLT